MAVERIQVGEVPVFLAEAPAPYQAGLLFRVGTVDEPLPRRGLTHLCEHLALSSFRPPEHVFNGFVTYNCTHFVMQGSTDDAVRYVEQVCQAMRSLDLDRLEKERRILLTEEASHENRGVVDLCLLWRFGAVGFGRCSYPEFGLRAVTRQQVEVWAAERFCTGAAALWLCGPDPAQVGERLSLPLRPGGAHPIPPITLAGGSGPSWVAENVAGPQLSFLVRRTSAFTTGISVLHQRLQQKTRHEHALAYVVGGSYIPLDRDLAHAHLGAEALPEHQRELTEVFFSVVDEFLERGPQIEELEGMRRRFLAEGENAFADASEAQRMAVGTLLGSTETSEEVRQEMLGVSPEAARQAVADAFGSSLLIVPSGVEPPKGFLDSPRWSDTEVGGTLHRPAIGSTPVAIVGARGLTCRWATGQAITIPVQACEALLRWEDGVRLAIGTDGFKVRIAPWEWRDGERLVRRIDETFPTDRWVPMGAGGGPPGSAAPHQPPAPRVRSPFQATLFLAIMLTTIAFFGGLESLSEPRVQSDDTGPVVGILTGIAALSWGLWWWQRSRGGP
jgi:zinc protease